MPAPTVASAPTAAKPKASAPTAPVASATPPVDPIADAVQKLNDNKLNGASTALRVYRELAFAVADGKALSESQIEALAHALSVLGVTSSQFKADVAGIKNYRVQLAAQAENGKLVAELESQSKLWDAELEKLRKRTLEITGLRGRLISAATQAGQHGSEAQRLTGEHSRVLGDLAAEVAKVTNPPPVGVGMVIRGTPMDTSIGGVKVLRSGFVEGTPPNLGRLG